MGDLLKFTPLGRKVPFHMAGQTVGMERAFCIGPRQPHPGRAAVSSVSVGPDWAPSPTRLAAQSHA